MECTNYHIYKWKFYYLYLSDIDLFAVIHLPTTRDSTQIVLSR